MTQKQHVMHGRDHCPGGADPIPCLDTGPTRDAGAWQDLVNSHGPLFHIDFQDDPTIDNNFNDITGHGYYCARPAFGGTHIARSNEAHMFANQTYSGKTSTDNDTFGLISPPSPWSNGQTIFSVEIWFRKYGHDRGSLAGNDAYSSTTDPFWAVGFNATGVLYLERFGTAETTTITPPLNEWHQYVVTGDGTTATLYYDGTLAADFADPTGSYGSGMIINREAIGLSNYAAVLGYYGAVVGYTQALTASQVAALYQAGLESGNPGQVPLPGEQINGHRIADEGTPVTARTTLDFAGAGVTATDDPANDKTLVTIPGGGGGSGVTVKKEGVTVGTRAAINFHESAPVQLTITDDAANNEVDVTVVVGYPSYAALLAGVTSYADILA